MGLLHTAAPATVSFNDPALVTCAGLVPVLRLFRQAGLDELAVECVRPPGSAGANVPAKIGSLVGRDDRRRGQHRDLDLLRHRALGRLADQVKAPPRWAFLRAFTHGHVGQLQALLSRFANVQNGLSIVDRLTITMTAKRRRRRPPETAQATAESR